jgi:hypothetical protein
MPMPTWESRRSDDFAPGPCGRDSSLPLEWATNAVTTSTRSWAGESGVERVMVSTPVAMPVNCRHAADYCGTVSCQVPISLYRFPPEKWRPPESLHFAFGVVGATLARFSIVTPVLALLPHALPLESR